MNSSHEILNNAATQIQLMAFLVVLVAGVAFVTAKTLGGKSKLAKQFIFFFISTIGLGLVAMFTSSQI